MFAIVAVLGAVFAASALAVEAQYSHTFQEREWVGPYGEGKHSTPDDYLVEIQGEGWQYESCIDMYIPEAKEYAFKRCATKKEKEAVFAEYYYGYARVWNARDHNNEIWGWRSYDV